MNGKPNERRTGFYILPNLPLGWRVSIVWALVALGIAMQLRSFLIGFVVIIVALLLMMMRRIDNTPDTVKDIGEEWESVTPDEIKKISERVREFKRWGAGVLNSKSCLGFLVFLFLSSLNSLIPVIPLIVQFLCPLLEKLNKLPLTCQ